MTDQLDARIRAFVRELVDSSPAAPGFEDIEWGLHTPDTRPRLTRRTRVVVAIAACLVVALVIGSILLFARDNSPSVESPARPPTTGTRALACAGKAYVNNQGDNTVSAINLKTGAVSAPIPVGANPGGLAVSPDGKHVYVANPGDSMAAGTVSVIDTATGTVSATIPVGKGPGIVEFTPDGKQAYVLTCRFHGDGDRHCDGHSVGHHPRRQPPDRDGVLAGRHACLRSQSPRWHGVGDRHDDGCRVGHHHRRRALRSGWRLLPTASTST